MSMKCCLICRSEKPHTTVRSRATTDSSSTRNEEMRMQCAPRVVRAVVSFVLIALSVVLSGFSPALGQAPQSKFADVNVVKLHYLIAGKGDPVVLLHGFAETSHMCLPRFA